MKKRLVKTFKKTVVFNVPYGTLPKTTHPIRFPFCIIEVRKLGYLACHQSLKKKEVSQIIPLHGHL